MFIRNGANKSNKSNNLDNLDNLDNWAGSAKSNMPDISKISNNIANISDISELKTKAESNTFETITINSNNPSNSGGRYAGSDRLESLNGVNSAGNGKSFKSANRLLEYLYNRRYYILAMAFIYVTGVIIGSVLIKNLDRKDTADLCSVIDKYFTGIASINMTARILSNITLNMIFIFGIYICGITIFSPLVCSAFCLYKGLTCGFIIGVYIIGGSTKFHWLICGITFVLYLFIMIFFILTSAESMSFSSFLFKNEESFKDSLSFKNVSVYSSRYLLFLILISLSTVFQTLIIPVIYAVLG